MLAKRDADGVSIRRGDLETAIVGSFALAMLCYRCRTLNIVSHQAPSRA
jgi:hypothetical protein